MKLRRKGLLIAKWRPKMRKTWAWWWLMARVVREVPYRATGSKLWAMELMGQQDTSMTTPMRKPAWHLSTTANSLPSLWTEGKWVRPSDQTRPWKLKMSLRTTPTRRKAPVKKMIRVARKAQSTVRLSILQLGACLEKHPTKKARRNSNWPQRRLLL